MSTLFIYNNFYNSSLLQWKNNVENIFISEIDEYLNFFEKMDCSQVRLKSKLLIFLADSSALNDFYTHPFYAKRLQGIIQKHGLVFFKDDLGRNVFHYAAYFNNPLLIKMISRISPSASLLRVQRDAKGYTPLDFAINRKNYALQHLLVRPEAFTWSSGQILGSTSAPSAMPMPRESTPPNFFQKFMKKPFFTSLIILFSPLHLAIAIFIKAKKLFFPRPEAVEEIRKGLYQAIHDSSSDHPLQKRLQEDLLNLIFSSLPEENLDLFLDFLSVKEAYPHFKEILCGANVKVQGPAGDYLFEKWKGNPNAYQRVSSHRYQPGTCFGISGRILREVTFWKDEEGCLRMQIENRSAKSRGFRNIIEMFFHLMDYLHYKRDQLQQSQFGTSKYTEDNCLEIDIDLAAFQEVRAVLKKSFLQKDKSPLLT
ncbi:MAG: hypothetical protein Tsb0015_01960 [Simkaniaceae bacterium]